MARVPLLNHSFELGDIGWTKEPGWAIIQDPSNAMVGSWVLQHTGTITAAARSESFATRPGMKIQASAFIKGGSGGTCFVRVTWRNKNLAELSASNGNSVGAGNASYVQSFVNATAPAHTKSFSVEVVANAPSGTWTVDQVQAGGDYVEDIPAVLLPKITTSRMIGFDTVAVFEPLVGDRKFSTFNGGMSDRWSGLYTFAPLRGDALRKLRTWLRRVGHYDFFFAFDPDVRSPSLGSNPNLQVWGDGQTGTQMRVLGGSPNQTVLVEGDYFECASQYFQVQRDFRVGPDGSGFLEFWPALRTSPANGEYLIVDNPKMIARITSDIGWLTDTLKVARDVTISWEERV